METKLEDKGQNDFETLVWDSFLPDLAKFTF